MRTFVMGDIHGNYSALMQCLERSPFDHEQDVLIQLGDVSDRHQDTALVVEELLKVKNLIALMGNHDIWTCEWLNEGKVNTNWLKNGGEATIRSYEKEGFLNESEHKLFFRKMRAFYIDHKNRLYIHAGYVHESGPEMEESSELFFSDRTLWRKALSGQATQSYPKLLRHFSEIFIGHTPTLNWHLDTPMYACNVWNLDTGAGWTGKLTIMDVATKEYWQSDSPIE